MKTFSSLSLFVLLFWGTFISYAQPPGGFLPRGRERLDQFRKLKLIEVLDLTEENALRFFAKLNEHENKMQEIQKQRNDLIDSLEILVNVNASDKTLEKMFDGLMEIETKTMNERKNFRGEVKGILTTEQMAKFFVFERKFRSEVRDVMEEKMRDKGQRRMREKRDE